MVWRFGAVRENGGTGLDSSEEELGLEDVAGDGVGGVVRSKQRARVGTEDCSRVALGGLQGSICGGGESHIDNFLTSMIDKRRMNILLTVRSHPLFTLQS